jgi:hypothetical protein
MHPWSPPKDFPLGQLSSATASDRRIRGDRSFVNPQPPTFAIQAPTIGPVGHGDDRPQLHGVGDWEPAPYRLGALACLLAHFVVLETTTEIGICRGSAVSRPEIRDASNERDRFRNWNGECRRWRLEPGWNYLVEVNDPVHRRVSPE